MNSLILDREVFRRDLKTVFRICQHSGFGPVTLNFLAPNLHVQMNEMDIVIPATGEWEGPIIVAGRKFFTAVNKLPDVPVFRIYTTARSVFIGKTPILFKASA